jgi:hypothetical protein
MVITTFLLPLVELAQAGNGFKKSKMFMALMKEK